VTPSFTPSRTPTGVPTATPTKSVKSADFNTDGIVDSKDALLLVEHFMTTETQYDLNSDGRVNARDQFLFSASWQKNPSPCPDPERSELQAGMPVR